MTRPTKERLEEIRQVTLSEVDVCYFCIDLLAEIDALEAENKQWKLLYNNLCEFTDAYEQERDQLRKRVAKLREAIEYITGPPRSDNNNLFMIASYLNKALAADDEMEGK